MTTNHVENAREYPAFAQGYLAVGASKSDEAALIAAGHFKAEDDKWYASGYHPVRGGWGYVGNNGVGHGPAWNTRIGG